jgi:hypothetical protein
MLNMNNTAVITVVLQIYTRVKGAHPMVVISTQNHVGQSTVVIIFNFSKQKLVVMQKTTSLTDLVCKLLHAPACLLKNIARLVGGQTQI